MKLNEILSGELFFPTFSFIYSRIIDSLNTNINRLNLIERKEIEVRMLF